MSNMLLRDKSFLILCLVSRLLFNSGYDECVHSIYKFTFINVNLCQKYVYIIFFCSFLKSVILKMLTLFNLG